MPNTVRLHRVLATRPEKVYRAFLEADAMAKWLPPDGFACTVHSMEPKVGGGFRMSFRNFTTGESHAFGGRYVELVPNERLRYTDTFDDPNLPGEMEVTVTLKTVSVGTDVEIVQAGIPDLIPVEACYLGWQQSLENLVRLVVPDINQQTGQRPAARDALAVRPDHIQKGVTDMGKTLAILIARLIFAAVFLMACGFKFADMDGTAGYIAAAGIPFPLFLAWVAALFELGLVLAFLTGAFFSEAALAAAAYVLFLAFTFHGPSHWQGSQAEFGFFVDHFTFTAGLLFAAVHGPGSVMALGWRLLPGSSGSAPVARQREQRG